MIHQNAPSSETLKETLLQLTFIQPSPNNNNFTASSLIRIPAQVATCWQYIPKIIHGLYDESPSI